jgi:aspartyl-tRNA(Asn)/glutamyl-tRNA(Gln) amidotransferase subunit C
MSRDTRGTAVDLITPPIFDHLVELAALELEPDEAAYLRRELNHQLEAIRELEAIQVDPATPITSHGVDYTPEISPLPRPDESRPCSEADEILAQAPETDGRYIAVPDIPHTDLA